MDYKQFKEQLLRDTNFMEEVFKYIDGKFSKSINEKDDREASKKLSFLDKMLEETKKDRELKEDNIFVGIMNLIEKNTDMPLQQAFVDDWIQEEKENRIIYEIYCLASGGRKI